MAAPPRRSVTSTLSDQEHAAKDPPPILAGPEAAQTHETQQLVHVSSSHPGESPRNLRPEPVAVQVSTRPAIPHFDAAAGPRVQPGLVPSTVSTQRPS